MGCDEGEEVIWQLILRGLWKPILAVLAVLGVYIKGRSDAAAKADHKRAKEALETHERINDAEIADGPDDARAWLRDHADRLRRDRKP